MNEEKRIKAHPLIEKALELAHKGFEPVEFDDYAVEQLSEMLSEYFGKYELVEAVRELLTFACFLDTEKGCHSASRKIVKVVESSIDALEALKKENPTDIVEDEV